MTPEEFSWLRLHLTPGLGRTGLCRLMEAFGAADRILAAPPAEWACRRVRAEVALAVPKETDPSVVQAARLLDRVKATIVPLSDRERYPPLLRTIHDPPALLYQRGALPAEEALAIVGARRASEAGRRLTGEIAATLAARGIAIVSGLARGIDTAAHEGALAGNGPTVAVLGCGIDRIYPPENARLAHRILETGAILSEYPPGAPPLAGHFPGRNRIISGLSRGVMVVEAAEESGSLITADFALEQGREVFGVPGPVFSPTSTGVNRLLKEGAQLVTEARDILETLWPNRPSLRRREAEESFRAGLDERAQTVFRHLADTPLHVDEIARKCALTPMEVSVILLHLELLGGVAQLPGMRFVRALVPAKDTH